MANKHHEPEEIASNLRQVEVWVVQGMARLETICEVSIIDSRARSLRVAALGKCPAAGSSPRERGRAARFPARLYSSALRSFTERVDPCWPSGCVVSVAKMTCEPSFPEWARVWVHSRLEYIERAWNAVS